MCTYAFISVFIYILSKFVLLGLTVLPTRSSDEENHTGISAKMQVSIYCICIKKCHLLCSSGLFTTSMDYIISQNRSLLKTMNCGKKKSKTFFSFEKPHNETAHKTPMIYFTFQWKIPQRSSSNFNAFLHKNIIHSIQNSNTGLINRNNKKQSSVICIVFYKETLK